MIPWIYLKERRVIACVGEKSLELLQGLVTQDIIALQHQGARGGFAVLLTSKGFFQADMFVFFNHDGLFLECHEKHADMVLTFLQRYALLHDVQVSWGPPYAVCCALGMQAQEIWKDLSVASTRNIYYLEDPRHPLLGMRALIPYHEWQTSLHPLFIPESSIFYHKKRMELGIPDGGFDLVVDRSVILEYGYQHIQAISWNKGCYLGQELMARTFHRGQLRKTLYLLRQPSFKESQAFFPNCGEILFLGEEKAGVMGGSQGDIALASLYHDMIPDNQNLNFVTENGDFLFSAQAQCLYPLSSAV